MSSRLLRAACIGFCASFLALAASPAAKPDTQKAAVQKADAKVARTPVGTVTADSPIRINGVGLEGATAWPVFPGDIIETYSTDAKLKMKDGRSALLRKLSAVAVTGALTAAALNVHRGSVALYEVAGTVTQLAPQTSGSLFTTAPLKASFEPRLAGESESWKCKTTLLPGQVCPSDAWCKTASRNTEVCCTQGSGTYRCQ